MKNESKRSPQDCKGNDILATLYWAIVNHATVEVIDDPQVKDALKQARKAMGNQARKEVRNQTSQKLRSYEIVVKQIDYYSKVFLVNAESENSAKEKVTQMVYDDPLDTQKDTYDVTETELRVRPKAIELHTIESLFDPDKEDCNDEVVLLSDLTEEQKEYLGLQEKGA